MKPGVTLVLAMRSLLRHRVRTALAMLGIVIGIAAVIAMVALGQGTSAMVQAQIASMGRNVVMIWPGAASSSGGMSFGAGTNVTLTAEDGEAILREVPSVVNVTPVERVGGSNKQMVYAGQNWSPNTLQGTGHTYLDVREWPLDAGEFFTTRDVASSAKVCLLGRTVVDNLFSGASPLGETLRINRVLFRVVGVLSAKGANSRGDDQDDIVLVPYTTALNLLEGSAFDNVDQLLVAVASPEVMDQAMEEITTVLRARHRLAEKDPSDFQLRTLAEMAAAAQATTETMSTLLAGIASISLIVGGIGIMNIMLVSVTERTREIGLRLAVGARGRDILQQFLMEALLLAGSAGFIGIGVGYGATVVLAAQNGWPVAISWEVMGLAAAFSCAVGVFFGFYPALRASRLDPIEALRWE
jgi:putative ABC transport system permease protein